jgi:SpoVK/Ycf46/Vps4 family AAA+-type ATPase
VNGEMKADREHELEVLIRARYPIIYIVSWEERRVEESLRQVAARRKKKLYGWTVTKGVVSLDSLKPVGVDPTAKDPVQALEYVASSRDSAIFVLKDFHAFLDEVRSSANQTVVARKLRDIATELKESRKTLVLLSPVLQFPPELEKDITVLDYALPTLEELDQSLERVMRSARSQASGKRRALKLGEEERERVLKAAQGLTCTEAENVFAKSLVMAGQLDLDIIVAEKKQIIRKSRILEYYESRENFDYVGGMTALKEWLRKRGLAFSERARHFGLPEPRGLLLLGVQGAGKSLLAKAVASQWQLPLLKLDMGRVFSELVGSSEQNMRTVLSTAESVAPCLLWLDELEKGLAGTASSHRSDAGTAARVFGSLLTWMQEKTSPVFVIATANDIHLLPPEALRKGRFDEIFFIDLQDAEERREIFAIHLAKRGRDPQRFDLVTLSREAEGFSGAEIEQVVISGLYDAFESGREMETQDLRRNITDTVPLSQTMKTQIKALQDWACTHARPASIRK